MRWEKDEAVLNRLHEFLPPDDPPGSVEEYRRRYDLLSDSFPADDQTVSRWLSDTPAPILEVTVGDVAPERTVVYVHGGGLTVGSAMGYRSLASWLARAARARVLVVDFRLCPEHTMEDGLEDCLAAYGFARRQFPSQPVAIVGDSAGGGLGLSVALTLRDRGDRPPDAVVAWSPLTNRVGFLPSFDTNAQGDYYVTKEASAAGRPRVLGDGDPESVVASPLRQDMTGLPSLQLQVSGTEVLLDDSLEFAIKAARAGVVVDLHVIPGAIHVWQMFAPIYPEGQRSIERTGAFLLEHA